MATLALDTETTGTDFFHGCKPFALSAMSEDKEWYWEWPVCPTTRIVQPPKEDIREIKEIIRAHVILLFHNAKFDIRALASIGINWPKSWWKKTRDTLPLSHIVDSQGTHKLKELALMHADIPMTDQQDLREATIECRRFAKSLNWTTSDDIEHDYWLTTTLQPELELVKTYCKLDTLRNLAVWKFLQTTLRNPVYKRLYKREMEIAGITYNIESKGVTVNVAKIKKEYVKYQNKATTLELAVRSTALQYGLPGFNIRSTIRVADLLNRMGHMDSVIYTDKGNVSVSEDALSGLVNLMQVNGKDTTIEENILEYRTANKATEYLDGYLRATVGDCLHTTYNPWGPRTTRFSSKHPNLQNVGKKSRMNLRNVFGPPKGCWWLSFDYSQLELRILAIAAQEAKMIRAFENGDDIHKQTANLCQIPRDPAKAANYAIIYGAGARLQEKMTGVVGIGDIFFTAYPSLAKFVKYVTYLAKTKRYVTTLDGYRLGTPPGRPYAGVDYVIQGSAGDILKRAMVSCDKTITTLGGDSIKLLMSIHDELIFEVPVSTKTILKGQARLLKRDMEQAGKELGVVTPVDVSLIKNNWAEKQTLEV